MKSTRHGACTVRSEPARIERERALVATFGATQVDEAALRIAACEEVRKRLPDELGQIVAARGRVVQEAVELACASERLRRYRLSTCRAACG
jgi:hypothetical protein